MSPDQEPRIPPTRSAPDLAGEQEIDIDVGRYWSMLVARWWLPAAGVVLGLVIGFLATLGGGRAYEALAVVYLGQPLYPGTPQPLLSVSTNFKFVNEILHSEPVVKEAAAKAKVTPTKLRNGLSLTAFSAEGEPVKAGRAARLVSITITGLPPKKGIVAADALAAMVITRISSYTDTRLSTYQARLARNARELAFVKTRIDYATKQQETVLKDISLPPTERLLLLANFNNVINVNQDRRSNLEVSQLGLRDAIALTQQIERARVLEPAAAKRTAAPSRRAGAVVGGIIGLILGVLGTFVWGPLTRRLKKRSPQ